MFQVSTNTDLNRLYVIIGSLEHHEPALLIQEVMEAIKELKPGWTVITDLTQTLSPEKEHADLIGPAMKQFRAAGLGKAVRVVGNSKVFPGLWERLSASEGGYTAEIVKTMAEAEKLLDAWTTD